MIDKLADFVVRNGLAFEAMMIEKQKGNPKMGFLVPGGLHHAYYKWRIYELTMGKRIDLPYDLHTIERVNSGQEVASTPNKPNTPHETTTMPVFLIPAWETQV